MSAVIIKKIRDSRIKRKCDQTYAWRHAPLKIALNERLDEPDLFFAEEGMRTAAPAARKPTCLRRPVTRADVEFGEAVPSEAKERSE